MAQISSECVNNMEHVGAIILAAGKGKRMNLEKGNKVILDLHGKPIILHIIHFMKKIGIGTIVTVVGHEKDSVRARASEDGVLFAEQTEQLGTGHAVQCALEVLPEEITDVLVVYGDDAVLYNDKQSHFVKELFAKHAESGSVLTFLTVEQENPYGLGRIVRDSEGKLESIVEEKDATDEQRRITEINPGCFVFKVDFLKNYLPMVEKSQATGEYYLTSLIDLAIHHGEIVETVKGGKLLWRGVNTPEELQEAERLLEVA